ncbi:ribosome biogenesis GTPase YlqF [Plesiomonas sp. PI-19]|uniref:ribosome biogenesis GTPase YlqF n=1 Tax=Plesiomonas sp. PI-19 TaxID=2898798 RepID=UPI001EFFA266|nr:ribosome biogenesis GTPase YlqF [Plesiomonas sp. PI-19]MCE5163377.1 ribosome biogenesis GTPase YlqF [Plesiomonas sp. PI-19]
MAINWFPGHMHKARKEIAEAMPNVDLIIEVLDSRIPFSSENPLVPALRGDTPCLKILNKSDLADPVVTQQWMAHLEKEKGIKAIALTQQQPEQIRALLDLCVQMVPNRTTPDKPLRAMILGIPNVGKSTLINTLAGRTIAKTGNEAGVTKMQQRIKLDNNIVLHDTPGFLWPKLSPEACGYRLAITGAIKDTVIDHEEVAMFAAEYFLQAYPEYLKARFQLDELPESDIELMDEIGRQRGCLRRGGIADLNKVATLLLNEFRTATIGRISLETPEMIVRESEAEAIRLAQKAEQDELKKKKKKKRK